MEMQFKRTVPILRIFDEAKAREFYLDFLEFKLDFEHRFEPDLPLYMHVSRGAVTLGLSAHFGDGTPGTRVMIEMTGLKQFQEALLAKRYRHARPGLERQPWEATTMTIADPFHNYLVFTEHDEPAR